MASITEVSGTTVQSGFIYVAPNSQDIRVMGIDKENYLEFENKMKMV